MQTGSLPIHGRRSGILYGGRESQSINAKIVGRPLVATMFSSCTVQQNHEEECFVSTERVSEYFVDSSDYINLSHSHDITYQALLFSFSFILPPPHTSTQHDTQCTPVKPPSHAKTHIQHAQNKVLNNIFISTTPTRKEKRGHRRAEPNRPRPAPFKSCHHTCVSRTVFVAIMLMHAPPINLETS